MDPLLVYLQLDGVQVDLFLDLLDLSEVYGVQCLDRQCVEVPLAVGDRVSIAIAGGDLTSLELPCVEFVGAIHIILGRRGVAARDLPICEVLIDDLFDFVTNVFDSGFCSE